jgi:hypothetical protein
LNDDVIAYIASLHRLLESNRRDFEFINNSGYWGMHPFTHAVRDLSEMPPCPATQAIEDIQAALASVPKPYQQTVDKINAALDVATAARNWEAYLTTTNRDGGEQMLKETLQKWRNAQ